MSEVVIVPLIKILDPRNNTVKILLEGDSLPEFNLNTAFNDQVIDELNECLLEKYEIKSQWTEIYYVGLYVANGALRLYYSTFVPESFLNEATAKKITSDYSKLPIHDRHQIGQSFSILPY